MAAPGVAVETCKVLDDAGAQGVKMDVADQLQEICFLFTHNRLVAILEKMADSTIAEIEGYSMAGEEATHEGGELGLAGSQKKMEMIAHQRPGEAFSAGLLQQAGKAIDE